MFKSILIPVAIDHEPLIAQKIDLARKLMAPEGRITLLTVLEQIPAFAAELVTPKVENHLTDKIRAKLREAAGDAAEIDVAIAQGKAGVKIAEYADDNGTDLILVAAHHPNAMDYFLGSTAARVARRAPCSVHIMR
ncbi:MAG: universal stress protein [Pseudomonadota bacterium]